MVEGLGAPGASGFVSQYGLEGTGQCQLLLGYHRVQSVKGPPQSEHFHEVQRDGTNE